MKFENTRNVLQIVLRVILGTAIFAGVTVVLKLPFPKEVVERGDEISQAIRLFRYLVATFVGVGVYPLLIKKFPKVFG